MLSVKKRVQVDTLVYLMIIVTGAAFLRLYHLNYQSLWYDELHSVVPTGPDASVASIIEYSKTDQPPGLFLMLHYWFGLFAYNEFYARLLAAVIGIAGVVVMFFLGKEFKNDTVGLFAAFMTALNWFHINYSQDIRFYGLLFLLTALSFVFFIKACKLSSPLYFGLYALTGIALLYTHYFGMFLLFTQFGIFIWLIVNGKRDTKFIVYGIATAVVVLASFIPWLPVVLSDHAKGGHWITFPKWHFLATYYYVFLGKDPLLAVLYLGLAFLFIRQAWLTRSNKENTSESWQNLMILSLWVVLSFATPWLYSLVSTPIMHERYMIVVLPAIIIAVALGIELIKTAKIRTYVTVAIVLSTTVNFLFFNQYYTRLTKNQFREITRTVIAKNTSKAVIFSDQAWHYSFYFNQYNAPATPIDAYGVKFEEVLPTHSKVWVLQGLILPGVDSTQQAYLDKHYDLKEKMEMVGAAAFLYEQKPNTATATKRP